ncbi:MAG: dTDP-6-deoxy-3,4-keto-hexulose isomerase, partial [Bacteroidetes bacterium HGW-Bacteroidetes-22]
TEVLRAWQGHRGEVKAFYVVKGAFTVNAVRIEDPENPDPDAEPWVFRLSEEESKVLVLPDRYANGFQATLPGSKMIVFSNLKLDDSNNDIIRFPADYWVFSK